MNKDSVYLKFCFSNRGSAAATQKISFPFLFRFAAEGWGGGAAEKMQGNFWGCPRESASAARRVWKIGAEDLGQTHHARGACEVSRGSAGHASELFDTMTTIVIF